MTLVLFANLEQFVQAASMHLADIYEQLINLIIFINLIKKKISLQPLDNTASASLPTAAVWPGPSPAADI